MVFLLAAAGPGFAGGTNGVDIHPESRTAARRPMDWAQPLSAPGIRNFYEVTTNLYRGAQPTAEGMKQLKAKGIKTVINLRTFHSDKDKVAGTGMKSIRFEMEPWHSDEADAVRFLRVVTDTNNLPAFVHCERGADRTGMMCAMYRVVVCGWTKEQAIAEMKRGGFGFNPLWHDLVRFVEKADIADIKRRAGLVGK